MGTSLIRAPYACAATLLGYLWDEQYARSTTRPLPDVSRQSRFPDWASLRPRPTPTLSYPIPWTEPRSESTPHRELRHANRPARAFPTAYIAVGD
jgi:hypothetical protein